MLSCGVGDCVFEGTLQGITGNKKPAMVRCLGRSLNSRGGGCSQTGSAGSRGPHGASQYGGDKLKPGGANPIEPTCGTGRDDEWARNLGASLVYRIRRPNGGRLVQGVFNPRPVYNPGIDHRPEAGRGFTQGLVGTYTFTERKQHERQASRFPRHARAFAR